MYLYLARQEDLKNHSEEGARFYDKSPNSQFINFCSLNVVLSHALLLARG